MRLPIAVALGYPDRLADAVPPTALEELSGLEFHALDEKRFPSVRLAREAAMKGGAHPAVLNAANEEAVNAFLAGASRSAASSGRWSVRSRASPAVGTRCRGSSMPTVGLGST